MLICSIISLSLSIIHLKLLQLIPVSQFKSLLSVKITRSGLAYLNQSSSLVTYLDSSLNLYIRNIRMFTLQVACLDNFYKQIVVVLI